MNNCEFVNRCLNSVPCGTYRDRVERELQDHLLALTRDLEGAGHPQEEALTLAQERMGDPAELSRRYAQEWRRRTLGQRALIGAEQFLVGVVMTVMSYLYVINTNNFGKGYPAIWAFVAIPAAVILLGSSLAGVWTLARWTSWVITVIQLPPMQCWMLLGTFEMSGWMVSGGLGFGVHLLFFVWGIFNYNITAHFERAEDILSRAQSA